MIRRAGYLTAHILAISLLLAFLLPVTTGAQARRVSSPADAIGFTPGDDRKLASWSQFVDYFKTLDRESDRVVVEELGKTTLGRPFLLATISSPENLKKLDRYREIQRLLADPRLMSDESESAGLIAEGRAIVLITFGIHSTEVGSSLSSMNIAHRLAADDSPEIRHILENCIILMVPSLNPDGVDIVKDWYDRTLGTPAEGTGPVELYHFYTGHDNNRDWYAFTQVETQMTVDRIHNVWRPHIVHDIHQQGEEATRFFIPPFVDPWEPNVPPRIQAGVNFMGSAMAWEMINEGRKGVVVNAIYDAWTPARAYQHYHGGIRILSETASARLASPTMVPFDRQRAQVNVNPLQRSWNYPAPWPGGEWKLADIVDYMQSGAFALMRNAARYREHWIRNFHQIGKDAVRSREQGEPFAYLIPPPTGEGRTLDWRLNGLARIESILRRGDVEILSANETFQAAGTRYPAGTRIIIMAQPYGAFAKTLLEKQKYPDLREYPGGPPRRPYDVTAHTLPLLMGVEAVQIDGPFTLPRTRPVQPSIVPESLSWSNFAGARAPRVAIYKSHSPSMDEGWTRWVFDQYGVKYVSIADLDIRSGGIIDKYDCIIFPDQSARVIVEGLSAERYPRELTGGIGTEGVARLKEFLQQGGTVVTFNNAAGFAIEHLGVPVRNVLERVPPAQFFCPGSILRIDFDPSEPLVQGMPAVGPGKGSAMAWFERSPALEPTSGAARIVAAFAPEDEVLLSGWLLGGERIQGKGAVVEARAGNGRVLMFAFRPQYRGQSVATLPLIFNAMITSAAGNRTAGAR